MRLLRIATLFSLALTALLCTGYFAEWTLIWRLPVPGNNARAVGIRLEGGRAELDLLRVSRRPAMPPSFHWSASLRGREFDFRRCLWQFDVHHQVKGSATFWFFACPIWCSLALALICPSVWLGSRRRPGRFRFSAGCLQPKGNSADSLEAGGTDSISRPQARSHPYPALAPFSLALAASLCTGYFLQWELNCPLHRYGNQIPILEVRIGAGRAVLYFREQSIPPAPQSLPTLKMNWHWRLPDPRRAVWEFDAHPLPIAGMTTSWIFACPIWCLLIPCAVFPAIWFRKRPRPELRGFMVLQDWIAQKEDIEPQMSADGRR